MEEKSLSPWAVMDLRAWWESLADEASPSTETDNNGQYAVREVAPIPVIPMLGGHCDALLNLELLVRNAESGDRAAWARLYGFASFAMQEGYALPDPLHHFIADRLALISRLLGDGDPIDNAWRNELANAVKGKKLKRKSDRRFNKDLIHMEHRFNVAQGMKPGASHKHLSQQFHMSTASVKRLLAPSKTKGSGKM